MKTRVNDRVKVIRGFRSIDECSRFLMRSRAKDVIVMRDASQQFACLLVRVTPRRVDCEGNTILI